MAQQISFSWSVGTIIAIVVLILALVLMIIGKMPIIEGGLFAALALARLL